jgi:hypothetical protein
VTITPDAARQARRDAIQDLLARIGRGRAGPDIATLLAGHLDAEQADGDQAREQMAAAERDHDTRRVDLAQALGQRMDLPWAALLGSVRSVQQANADLRGNADRYRTDCDRWKADAEQARAQRDTAAASLADLRNDLYAERRAYEAHRLALSEALSLGTSAPWDAITERAQTVQAAAERAEAAERNARRAEKRCEDLRGESLRRGKEVVERNERIAQLERRAERAEADLKRVHEQRKELAAERYRFALRAERAEATLTRVRNMPRLCGDCQINLRAFLDAEQQAPAGALGDPQPATEPEPRERPAEQPRCSCAGVGYGGKGDCPVHDAEREQPAEPDGAALWAAIRDHAAADLTWWDAVRHRLGDAR